MSDYVYPKKGDKVKYVGTTPFWFTDIIEDAKKFLKVGETYTISEVNVLSSFTLIKLEETGDSKFSFGFFQRQ